MDVGGASEDRDVLCRVAFSDPGECTNTPNRLTRPTDTEPSPLSIPKWVLVLSARLLVLPEAWNGWAAIHVKPCNIFAYCMTAFFFSVAWNAWGLNAASRPVGWVVLSASITYSACQLTLFLLVWRYGPMISKTKLFHAISTVMSAAHIWVCLRLLFWQGDYVPFGSHLLFTMVLAVGMWAMVVAGALGCWDKYHPPEPYRSCRGPVLAATSCILRMVDGFTDLLIIQLMLEQAQEPCYWFGAEGACVRWRVMAACAGVSAALDLAISVSLATSGFSFERGDVDPRKRRNLMRAHMACFLCEVSILAVTLVKLFSDFQEPSATMSAAERRNAVALTLGSFAVTVASFCLTMLGMKTVLSAVSRVGIQLRERISQASARSSRPTGQLQAVEAAAIVFGSSKQDADAPSDAVSCS